MSAPRPRRGPYPQPIVVERRRSASAGEHFHRQPRWPIVCLAALVLALTVAVIVLTIYVVDFADFVNGRGEYRDREAERVEQSVTDAVCDVLDQLPGGNRLDPVRDRYDCGPGVPPQAPDPMLTP